MRRTLQAANTAYNLADLLKNPDGLNAALAGAGAGNVDDGAHLYAVTFVSVAGESAPSLTVSVTVTDKTADGKVALTNIPIGPVGTLSRNVYRTVAAGSVLKLQSNIANNTATTLTDNTADASLTTTAPTVDSSGLWIPDMFYQQLQITASSGNSGNVAIDYRNPQISLTNYGSLLAAGGYYHFGNEGIIGAGDVWLMASSAADRIEIIGRAL